MLENFNYSFIERFNGSIDTLLIPPQNNFVKTIHIIHKQIDEKLKNIKKQWEDLNPEYKVELYDDEMCIEILNKYYGEKYSDIFKFIKDGPIKCDFFRACIIYIHGGIYVDSDIMPILPLKYYVDDDVDFMTCISYNYSIDKSNFYYNPQFIVSKKYSSELLNIINLYEKLYDDRETNKYDYWQWSICVLFANIHNFKLELESDNIFIFNNKKYKFLFEEIIDLNTKLTYNFKNFDKSLYKTTNKLDMYCKYKNLKVFENFSNK
jgi:hypothetical protein